MSTFDTLRIFRWQYLCTFIKVTFSMQCVLLLLLELKIRVLPLPRRPGHLMSTAEVEAALTGHPSVAEAAVVSRPHKVKGECLYCFVSLKDHLEFNRTLQDELKRLGEDADWKRWKIHFFDLGRTFILTGLSCCCYFKWPTSWYASSSEGEDRSHCHTGLHPKRSLTPKNSLR